MKVSPIGALIAMIVLGITIEIVERESKQAAYGLVLILLLGMITFNALEFRNQIAAIISVANKIKPAATATPTRH